MSFDGSSWPTPSGIGQILKTHNEEVEYLKKWIEGRLLWIDHNIKKVSNLVFICISYLNPSCFSYACFILFTS